MKSKFVIKMWVIATLCFMFLILAGCGNSIEDFRKVEAGWTLDQVRELLGEPDEIREAKGLAAVWKYEADGTVLTVTAMGDRVAMTALNSRED